LPLGDQAQLAFPMQEFGHQGTHELFGVVTNRKAAGDEMIWWRVNGAARARRSTGDEN
jgi:hypothetical protein